jgi:hypothetical protein
MHFFLTKIAILDNFPRTAVGLRGSDEADSEINSSFASLRSLRETLNSPSESRAKKSPVLRPGFLHNPYGSNFCRLILL